MTKNTPAFNKRLNHIRVTVWRNATPKKGDNWFTTEVKRRYVADNEWHDSYSLNGVADICLAIEALQQAKDFIRSQEAVNEGDVANDNE